MMNCTCHKGRRDSKALVVKINVHSTNFIIYLKLPKSCISIMLRYLSLGNMSIIRFLLSKFRTILQTSRNLAVGILNHFYVQHLRIALK